MTFLFPFDQWVLVHLTAYQTYTWVLCGIIVSEFGRATTIVLLTLGLALFLGLKRHFALMQGLALSVATSGIATLLLKGVIARPRPPIEYWAYHEIWYSFPSAHASLSMAFYGSVFFLVHRLIAGRRARAALYSLLAALVLAIGFARLYLGVHYLSDVLAGYLLGAACVWLGVWAVRALERGSIGS